MVTRLLLTSGLLLASAGYIAHATHAETVPPRQSLSTLPLTVDRWQGREGAPFTSNVMKELGVDDYITRIYTAGGEPFVSLYVGFYASQRQGDTIHSPLNCLPGAGWQPVRQDRAALPVTDANGIGRSITVNQFVIQKGLDTQVVLYWYQSHGRVIASEYTSKMFMVYDAMRLNRTDAAMIRVITPVADSGAEQERAGVRRAAEFVRQIFPALSGVLPS